MTDPIMETSEVNIPYKGKQPWLERIHLTIHRTAPVEKALPGIQALIDIGRRVFDKEGEGDEPNETP